MSSPLLLNPNFQDGDGDHDTIGTPSNWSKSGTLFSTTSGHCIPAGSKVVPKYGTHGLVIGIDALPNVSNTLSATSSETLSISQNIDCDRLSFIRIGREYNDFSDNAITLGFLADSTSFLCSGAGNALITGISPLSSSSEVFGNRNFADYIIYHTGSLSDIKALTLKLSNTSTGTRTIPSLYFSHIQPVSRPRLGGLKWCDSNLMKTAYDASAATLSVSHGTASKGNLVDNAVNKTWTSGSVAAGTDITVAIDLTATTNFVNFIAIINHNIPEPNTSIAAAPDRLLLEGDTASTFDSTAGAPAFAQEIQWRANNIYLEIFPIKQYRYWRIRLDADAGTAHNISIGELYLGLTKEILSNYSWEHSILSSFKNNVYETQWGEKFTYQRHRQDSYELNFNDTRDATMFQIQALLNDTIYGSTNPFVLIPDPRKRECLFGRFQNEISQQILYKDYNRTSLIFTSESIGIQLTA